MKNITSYSFNSKGMCGPSHSVYVAVSSWDSPGNKHREVLIFMEFTFWRLGGKPAWWGGKRQVNYIINWKVISNVEKETRVKEIQKFRKGDVVNQTEWSRWTSVNRWTFDQGREWGWCLGEGFHGRESRPVQGTWGGGTSGCSTALSRPGSLEQHMQWLHYKKWHQRDGNCPSPMDPCRPCRGFWFNHPGECSIYFLPAPWTEMPSL